MKLIKNLTIYLLMIACAVVTIACSNGKSPVEPSTDGTSGISNDLPSTSIADIGIRSLLGVYDAVIDPVTQTFTVSPDNRTAQYHFPLTQIYPNVLQITGYGFSPNFWADIKLVHPFPGLNIKGFDPRVIAILPSNQGVRFIYPSMGVEGNNAVVLEPDGYTKLFDSLGGSIPGNVNPFKAYFKDQPYRVWTGTGVSEETQRWQMNLAGFGGPLQFKLVVDVSTNYPETSHQEYDNAPEPISITATVGPGLIPDGGIAYINVSLYDWQDYQTIKNVRFEAPDLFNGKTSLTYYGGGPHEHEKRYTGVFVNAKHAPAGEYKYIVSAMDQSTEIYMYNESSVTVSDDFYDGDLIWAKQAGERNNSDIGYAITVLSDNSTVVTGIFYFTATFGDEQYQTTITSAGICDIFFAKFNPDGSLAWVRGAGGEEWDYGFGITALSDDSIVATGRFNDRAMFGSQLLWADGGADIFVAKYNSNGTCIGAKRAGGDSGGEQGNGITALSDDSAVVTGFFYGPTIFGPGEAHETVLLSDGDYDIFIAGYNPNGTLAWAKRAGRTGRDEGCAVTTLSDDSVVVTGHFGYLGDGKAIFGAGEPNETLLISAGDYDIFLARYDPYGSLEWAKRAGSAYSDYGYGVTTLSDDSIVVTGTYIGIATFGQGEPNQTELTCVGGYDFFIARYNPDGTLAWAKSAGGSSRNDMGYGIKNLSDNSIVVTGYFRDSATFGPGETNETILNSIGLDDIFIARYNSDGTLAWAKSAGSFEYDFGYGITALLNDSSVVTGKFESDAMFGLGQPNQTTLHSTGYYDMFIARFAP